MRTTPDRARALYNDLTLQEAAKRLGVSAEHIMALGMAGEIEIRDYRLPGGKRGVYRVNEKTVEALRDNRVMKASA